MPNPDTADYPLDERDATHYEWRCFGTIVCEPLFDRHGRECDRLNDEARAEFYDDVVATGVGAIIEWHTRQALASARIGR